MCIIAALIATSAFFLNDHDAHALSSIVGSKHDLSVTGGGQALATTETEICVFCHTPHNSSKVAQLWNRELSTASYIPYSSSSMVAAPGQPTGTSKLCLSCHDGTIALGSTFSDPLNDIELQGGVTTMPVTWDAYLGTNLANDHPVSFEYQSSGPDELLPAGSLPNGVELDQSGEVQCTSCHNVHDDTYGNFLVTTNRASNLCISCHAKAGWSSSKHSTSNATWTGSAPNDPDPWPKSDYTTVQDNGCGNCHFTHSAPSGALLLKNAREEDLCYPCHNGKVAQADINVVMEKAYAHSVADFSGKHDPTENYDTQQVPVHVECADCHNGHQITDTQGVSPPDVTGMTKGVPGITNAGAYTGDSQYIYEICFKCHGDTMNNVGYLGLTSGTHVTRETDEWNTRLEFTATNESFHPVEAAARNTSPSLIGGGTLPNSGDLIYCHDCHSDNSGTAGPHGSDEEWILQERYVVQYPNTNNTADYAMCYKCHSESSILNDNTFGEHRKHIDGEDAPCSVCHDPHGVQAKTQGDSTHLINFDTSVVSDLNGQLYFVDYGDRTGACVLVCHGEKHDFKGDGTTPKYDYGSGGPGGGH
jgi:predicted CXXCH cytochrome family protein